MSGPNAGYLEKFKDQIDDVKIVTEDFTKANEILDFWQGTDPAPIKTLKTWFSKLDKAVDLWTKAKRIACLGEYSTSTSPMRSRHTNSVPMPSAAAPAAGKELDYKADPEMADCCYQLNCGCPAGTCEIIFIGPKRRLTQAGSAARCKPANQGR